METKSDALKARDVRKGALFSAPRFMCAVMSEGNDLEYYIFDCGKFKFLKRFVSSYHLGWIGNTAYIRTEYANHKYCIFKYSNSITSNIDNKLDDSEISRNKWCINRVTHIHKSISYDNIGMVAKDSFVRIYDMDEHGKTDIYLIDCESREIIKSNVDYCKYMRDNDNIPHIVYYTYNSKFAIGYISYKSPIAKYFDIDNSRELLPKGSDIAIYDMKKSRSILRYKCVEPAEVAFIDAKTIAVVYKNSTFKIDENGAKQVLNYGGVHIKMRRGVGRIVLGDKVFDFDFNIVSNVKPHPAVDLDDDKRNIFIRYDKRIRNICEFSKSVVSVLLMKGPRNLPFDLARLFASKRLNRNVCGVIASFI